MIFGKIKGWGSQDLRSPSRFAPVPSGVAPWCRRLRRNLRRRRLWARDWEGFHPFGVCLRCSFLKLAKNLCWVGGGKCQLHPLITNLTLVFHVSHLWFIGICEAKGDIKIFKAYFSTRFWKMMLSCERNTYIYINYIYILFVIYIYYESNFSRTVVLSAFFLILPPMPSSNPASGRWTYLSPGYRRLIVQWVVWNQADGFGEGAIDLLFSLVGWLVG